MFLWPLVLCFCCAIPAILFVVSLWVLVTTFSSERPRLGRIIGLLEIWGIAVWGYGVVGLGGAPFGADPKESALFIALLVAGPLSVLPAAIVAERHPVSGALWLLAGALVSFCLSTWAARKDYLTDWHHFFIIATIPMLLLAVVYIRDQPVDG